jgi:26S proteasome regulatory subunit N1
MVASKNEDVFDALKYCLTGTKKDLVSWGHEYLRCLAGQIGSQYEERIEKDQSADDILELVD